MKTILVAVTLVLALAWYFAAAPAAAPAAAKKEPATMSSTDPSSTQPVEKLARSDAEWKKLLTPSQYAVLREKGTERAFTGEYDHHFEPGAYSCAACGFELFESTTKFNSGCGWPAFYAAKAGNHVKLTEDRTHGMRRTEVTCARCDSHLGHIFDDAPQTPTGQRFCINSVSIKFTPAPKGAAPATRPK